MDLHLAPAEQEFQAQIRAWLKTNPPPQPTLVPANEDSYFEDRRAWERKLYRDGWAGISWPREYGGRGATLMEQVIFFEAVALAGGPDFVSRLGAGILAPALMKYGTEAQKRRFLPKILSLDEIWCQGFSEPGAGSDLAALSTRADVKNDHFVVTGQKVWTTLGPYADWCFVLCRTNPDAPKHKGISMVLVDMKSPGITVRPLRQISGGAEFSEVFFDQVVVPRENLLGDLHGGWPVAMYALSFERSVNFAPRAVRLQQEVMAVSAMARRVIRNGRPAAEDPVLRQKLAGAWIDAHVVRQNFYRLVSRVQRGEDPGAESSILKVVWSEALQRLTEIALEVQGPHAALRQGCPLCPDDRWHLAYLTHRASTIYAGTSEIQRNIIAERALGLPR